MSGLPVNEKALAVGCIAEKIGGLHYVGESLDKFCVYLLADFLPSVAALTKIVQPFKEWTITLREGSEVSPLFCLFYVGDGEPDIRPLIDAICGFLDRNQESPSQQAVEKAMESCAPRFVM